MGGENLVLVIDTVFDLLSLVTIVTGLCVATLACLRLVTRFQSLDNWIEYLYVVLISLAISLWALLPLLGKHMPVSTDWMWLSILGVTFALNLYAFSICRELMPRIIIYTGSLVLIAVLLIVPYSVLLLMNGTSPLWITLALLMPTCVFFFDTAMIIKLSLQVRDRLYIIVAAFLMMFSLCFAAEAVLHFQQIHLTGYFHEDHLFGLIGALFLIYAVGFLAMDRAYLNSIISMNARVENAREELAAQMENIEDVVISLARTIDAKDKYTEGHTERVSQYAVFLGERVGLSDRTLETLRIGALIHDLGKIGIDLEILNKPGKLTADELAQIRLHPALGQQICSPLKALQEVGDIIRHHHEKLDGSGYPDGLTGDQISLHARIVSIVDIFDALTTERSYRDALPVEEAMRIMKEEAAQGKLDSSLVAEFESMLYDMAILFKED